ncbi:unnamed protein product [Adineta steineri]|uniref:Uncharacterized protein n=1 Tax=Adineta steineri TaxID=433720 RepID=A0A815TDD1_9BILA|nr:unnamed protein product [Adineta steineri]
MARIPRQQPMYISTLNINVDDLDAQSQEDYRYQHSAQETISLKSPKTNTRSYLIILVVILIIITLLSIVALVIAIYSLALTMKNSATNTVVSATTVNTATISASAECSSSPLTTYQVSTTVPPQCSNYTLNTDETRNIAYTSSLNYCDNILPFNSTTPVWIRFQDQAGTLIAKSPVPPNSCGSTATGWYAGQYPSAFFTTATSIVCFFYIANTCYACSSISITNCQTFYVFLLPVPPSCNYRYCTL